ncbi:MAG: phage tail protein [Streptococcaceae bacterium]|nr:phage tail protein [Streptococcaceae bacterium]
MSFAILHSENETNFSTLGLGVLRDATRGVVHEKRNGEFFLEMEYPIDGLHAEKIKENRILRVDAGHRLKAQRFDIKRINKTSDKKLQIYAEHVRYRAQGLPLNHDIYIEGTAQTALNRWKSEIIGSHPFTVYSDVTTNASTHWKIPDVADAGDALGGVEGSILDRWHGEYLFDNFHIQLLSQRGRYANTILAYGRNITSLEQEKNIANTYTSIYPYATFHEDEKEIIKLLPEKIIDGKYINNYPSRKVQVVNLSDKFKDIKDFTDAKLRQYANAYLTENNVGLPSFSLTVKAIDLSKVLEYQEAISQREELELCDTVPLYYPSLGINDTAQVTGVVWNFISERYDEYEFGNFQTGLKSWLNGNIEHIKQQASLANQKAIIAVISANGKNTNFYGNSSQGKPANAKDGDLYFEVDGDKINIYQFIDGVWVDLLVGIPTKDFPTKEQITQEILEEIEKERVKIDQEIAEAENRAKEKAQNLVDQLTNEFDENKKQVTQNINEATQQAQEKAKQLVDQLTQDFEDEKGITKQAIDKAKNEAIAASSKMVNDLENEFNQEKVLVGQKITDAETRAKNQAGALVASLESDFNQNKTAVSNAIGQAKTQAITEANNFTQTLMTNLLNDEQTFASIVTEAVNLAAQQSQELIGTISSQVADHHSKLTAGSLAAINANLGTITAGTINANLVTITNLNASNISSGTLSADRLAAGSITAQKLNVAQLSAITSDLGTLTAGTINASLVNITNLNASALTTGTLAAARLGAGSITADKLSVSQLSAISSNLGTLTAGVIDASLVTITKLDASAITVGTLAAARLGAASITADKLSVSQLSAISSHIGTITAGTINALNMTITNLSGTAITVNSLNGDRLLANTIAANKLSVSQLSAISSNLGTLTAGVIDASLVTITKLDASAITVGTLAAARLGAASITADKLSVSQLSAISSNLGTLTAGSINAALVTITNLSADALTSGTIAAARIGANTITSDKINVTSLAAITGVLGTLTSGTINGNVININNINANNIVAGTLNASLVNVANLNAANISTGTLNAARIGAGTITADKVSANFLQAVTANASVRITGTEIAYYQSGVKTTAMNSVGAQWWRDGVNIGRIGTNNLTTSTAHRGLVFDLEFGAQYMTWAAKLTSTASQYTTRFTWYRSNLGGNNFAGFHFDDAVYFNGRIGTVAGNGTSQAQFARMVIAGGTHLSLQTVQGAAGIVFASSNLFIGDDGVWVDFGIIREICKKLAGRTIALPTSFHADGRAAGWYNPQAFNTWMEYAS